MMDTLFVFGELGFYHIVDVDAPDHLLFLLALAIPFSFAKWKPLLKATLLFALGHTLSMVAVYLKWVDVPVKWVELLIPITIGLTGLLALFKAGDPNRPGVRLGMALLFGLIHGMGFGRYYGMLAADEGLGLGIGAFALGLEAAQVAVLLAVLLVEYLAIHALRWNKKSWNLFLAGGVFFLSLFWTLQHYMTAFS